MSTSQVWTEQVNRLRRGAERQHRLAEMPPGARVAAIEGERNRQIVFHLVRNIGDLAITDITERTGLSRETVSRHLRDLAGAGQVVRMPSKRWVAAA